MVCGDAGHPTISVTILGAVINYFHRYRFQLRTLAVAITTSKQKVIYERTT